MKELTYEELRDIGKQNIIFSEGDTDAGNSIDGQVFSNALVSKLILPDLGSVSSLYLEGTHFKSVQFIERSLFGINLLNVQFENCVNTNCIYRKAVFSDVTFKNTIFWKCDFSRALFTKCKFENCVFVECDFSNTIISEKSIITNSIFSKIQVPILNDVEEQSVLWDKVIS